MDMNLAEIAEFDRLAEIAEFDRLPYCNSSRRIYFRLYGRII